ncbi:MAG: hypothetical protein M3Q70_03565 [bacterium]|nr:hypothetical protein [bacterium]
MPKKAFEEMTIATEALIAMSYGAMETLNGKLPYHNRLHAWDVVRAANGIGSLAVNRGLIKPKDLLVLLFASATHDLVQGETEHGANERMSAEMAADWMRKFKVFSKKDIKRAGSAILATMSDPIKPGYQQTAGDDYIEQALCDADMSQVGMPPNRSSVRSERLYKELLGDDLDTPEFRLSFLNKQLFFYSKHQFYTDEARILFPFKQLNIERTVRELESLG